MCLTYVLGVNLIQNAHVVGNYIFETNLQMTRVKCVSKCNCVLKMWLLSISVSDLSGNTW